MAKKDKDSARNWLKMWEDLDPDNPELLPWKLKLDGDNLLKKLKSMFTDW